MKKLLVFAATFLFSVCLWAQNAQTGGGRYDAQIQQDVTKLLQSKDKWNGITASTDDAIVTLTGQAKVLIDSLDAAKKVSHLDHVQGVRNHVDIESHVTDAQLQEELADKLRYDRLGFGSTFNSLGLKVENGVVTISGDVIDYPSRDSALALIETTRGVREVIDNINVLPVSPMDDRTRLAVERAIYGNSTLSRYATDPQRPIRIVVQNGHVTLYGVVDSQMDKQIADTQAKSVPGVFSVEDKLIVAGKG
jgi:hyperosmotically inducible periplasmic protein